jgi:hypothetical protein
MSFVLVKFQANYADEFDVYGFAVFQASTWEEIKELARDLDWSNPIERYFGTNEAITFKSYADYIHHFKVTTISEAEFLMLKKLFGTEKDKICPAYFGQFLTVTD